MEKYHWKSPLFLFDREKRLTAGVICGTDEAGRGCLAGDVYAAAVVFDNSVFISGLDDSKKLTASERERLYDEIAANAAAYSVKSASVEEIEKLNILHASLLAMSRALEDVNKKTIVNLALVDGNQKPPVKTPLETVVKGDGKSASIAAASVLAKVARDRYMDELDKIYPQYQFAKHKGYATKLHRELILEHGASPVHRPSFLKKLLNG